LLKMRGNGDCRCLNDQRRERFDWPMAWKQKRTARLVEAPQGRIDRREKPVQHGQAERAAQDH
jgi:hypothetical protein